MLSALYIVPETLRGNHFIECESKAWVGREMMGILITVESVATPHYMSLRITSLIWRTVTLPRNTSSVICPLFSTGVPFISLQKHRHTKTINVQLYQDQNYSCKVVILEQSMVAWPEWLQVH